MSRRRASSSYRPPPPRAPHHPPKPPDISKPMNPSSSSTIAQTALGFSFELDSLDPDDEPDPDVDSLVSPLLFVGFFSRGSKCWLPIKLSSPSRESWIGSVTFSVNFRRFLLLIVINTCDALSKINKIPAFKAPGSYCAIHSPLRCSPLWPLRSLQNQQLDPIFPPLTMPSCARRCCLHGCFPGTEARRLVTIECVHWFSSANPFYCLLRLETRRSFNRFPPLWSESFRHSLAMCILKSVAIVAVAFCLIRLPLRFEESLKLDFRSIKSEAFSAETVWNFIILSIMFYVFALVRQLFMHLFMPLFVSESPRYERVGCLGL